MTTSCPTDHGLGPITGIQHGAIVTYRRPWWRLFRKTYFRMCHYCDLVERV